MNKIFSSYTTKWRHTGKHLTKKILIGFTRPRAVLRRCLEHRKVATGETIPSLPFLATAN